ncbi:MAG: 50S ribosomal protein L23 [Aureispira sp.]|nr:50S ribosomal protein L23 [Aureispira sp.]
MAKKNIIVKPLITEKTTKLAEDPNLNQYTFVVNRKANKVEIKKAVEDQFGVTVQAVNTSVLPGKKRSRIVKGRQTTGRTSPIKKAVVTIGEGEFIDGFYGDIEEVEDGLDTVEVEE